MEDKYFKTVYDENTQKYTIYFKKNPNMVLTNVDSFYQHENASKHIKIKKDGEWTLYDSNGKPEKHAKNVDEVWCRNDNFYETNEGEYYTRQGKIRNAAMYTVATLTGLAILGGLTKCVNDSIQESEAFDKTPATYLDTKQGVVLFDTDGDKKTTEVVAFQSTGAENVAKRFDANVQPGETHLISEWRDLGYFHFERIKQDKQNAR